MSEQSVLQQQKLRNKKRLILSFQFKPEYYKDAPHFRRVGDGPEYRLEIPSAKLDFTGTYSVIASNCYGQTQAIISLQIYAKDINKIKSMEKGSIRHGNVETLPLFIRPLKDLRCCDGDAITLECHVEAVPEPVIIWEKDGHVLHSGKDVDMVYDGTKAILSVRRVYPEDEGEYTCVAKNNVGRAFSSACIIVDVPEEKENLLSRQLARPSGLLSASSTPRSTPRTTPNRSVSPLRLSFRHTSIDLTTNRRIVAAPKFYAIPHNKVVEEGDSVRFQCAITGHPTPWSTWDKDGMIVTPTTRISIKEIEDLRILEIDEVTFDDAGLYRITLENDYGRIEATARLDVIGSSKHSKSPMGRAVRSTSSRRNFFISRRIMGPSTRIGGRMALSTSMRGSSVPARKFYHNGDEVMESERVQIVLTDSEARLIVDNVTEADEGIYTCIAQDENGAQATSTAVAFYNDDTDIPCDPPKILRHLSKTLEVCEGATTDLAFELECYEPYEYVWTRNGEVLPDSSEFKYIDHGNGIICLRIQDTFDLDTGLYKCTVTSTYGTCSTRCELQVDDRHPAAVSHDDVDRSGLAILKNPLPVLGMEGMITSFCAKVYPPNSQTSWTICGRDVTIDSRNFSLEESHSDGVRILHVLGLDYSHSGEVQFTVQSAIRPKTDRITTCTSLVVLPGLPKAHFQLDTLATEEASAVPAYINQGPTDCTALVGETVRLNVTFGGYPVPSVKWFKAGRPIIEGSNIKVHTTVGQSVLELLSITADDSGKYTVEVMNDHSSYYSAASVAVEGPPEPPSGKPSISQGPDRIAVAWCGPPYDGGCMLTGFIIEMQEENNGEWKEIATVVDSLAYTVKNLTPESAYRFRVRAENIHGRSEPSLASDRVEIAGQEVANEDFQKTISIKSGGDFKHRFEIIEELGKGRFGVVYKVQEKDTSQILAAKVIKCIKSIDRQKVKEEISIMQSLQHPKLLQLAASFESPREIVMVMEYITGGELFERVVADDFTLTERDCILFLRQVCEGVDYMHSQSIVHLDLKPENIMCHTRTSHQIKIIDFGLAQRLNTDSPVRVLFGTPEFIPPEIISYEPISFQSDMWSVGVVCYVLLSGLSPFMGDTDSDTFSNITRADYDFEDDAFDTVSQEAKDFISNLLIHRKEDRLTAKECLESKWLTQHHDENLNNNKICTDKLKKFIIRRKWQKTGNAIRALGRMANLSASRRNSAVSTAGSVPSSPRPSLSGTSIFSANATGHMTSLNEEEDDFNPELPSVELKLNVRNSLKVRDKTQCSERSDSGFSECSNCSGGVNSSCHCPNTVVDRSNTTTTTKDSEEDQSPLSVAVPHDILKTKLEEIAKTQLVEHDGSQTATHESKVLWENKPVHKEKDLEESPYSESKSPDLQFNLDHKSPNVATDPIMRSDFTNTIKMRKKSLENNLLKEKAKPPKVILETSGKVSMLKNKFSQGPAVKSVSNNFECKTNPKPSNDVNRPKNVFDRLTSSNKSNGPSKTCASISLPGSPLPTRSATTMRLSGRVKEATERLSQPKTPQATRKFTNNTTITTNNNNNEINLKKSTSDHHHAKNLKAFRGLS
ncbi:myosin light chain kinase, smooth muscle-like isoform X1 [Episyrphus balteatus]|uniref:myosin light chain kinase, smooth muscle-like isoform X1 n=1 Tax=Episyrphus balteatus TaxID=286459 RepID=UPI002485FCE2|nr:myosin light chain kinase, smooth muscle-like isoform X1 [Episyrphus balteatus]